jgi:hypothetical protein
MWKERGCIKFIDIFLFGSHLIREEKSVTVLAVRFGDVNFMGQQRFTIVLFIIL